MSKTSDSAMEQLTIYLNAEVARELAEVATATGISKQKIIRESLREYLAKVRKEGALKLPLSQGRS